MQHLILKQPKSMSTKNEQFIDSVMESFKTISKEDQEFVAMCLIANLALEAAGRPSFAVGIIESAKLDLHKEIDKVPRDLIPDTYEGIAN
jgi:hypothetical protein